MRYRAVLVTAVLLPLVAATPADVLTLPSGLRSLESVLVDHPGNAPDDNGLGAVAYPFRIGN